MSLPGLGGGDVSMFGGAHHDVMTASPEDEQSKDHLVEEIKNRGRAAIAAKNYLEAELLYGKGIEVKPDAVLYGNRSAARLSLRKAPEALADADASISLDSTYPKAYFRRGQALLTLKRPAEAQAAFESGLALEPDSKAFQSAITKAKTAVTAAAAAPPAAAAAAAAAPAPAATTKPKESPKAPTEKKKKTEVDNKGAAAAAANGAKQADAMEVEEPENEEGGGEALRGYKKREDGRVTTYFNRDLTDEAKALLGDIAPKKIVPAAAATAAAGGTPPAAAAVSNGGASSSAWNVAGTWEDKDMTRPCKERLEELVKKAKFDTSAGETVEVTAVKDLKGDASITFSRGKKRYLFDFNFDLEWEAELECGRAKGKLHYPDVSYDSNGEYEAQLAVDASTPPQGRAFVDKYVRSEREGIQAVLRDALNKFVADFQSMG